MPAKQPAIGAPLGLELRAALAGWERGAGPRHERLAAALARAIADGRLVAGTLLPPERALAAQLGVGRPLVAAAYGRLAEAGQVERRRGRGTQVRGTGAERLGRRGARRATDLQANAALRDLGARDRAALDLRSGSGPPSPAVLDVLDAAVAAVDVRRVARDAGYDLRGYAPLRERLAADLTAGGQTTAPEEILVTSGAQQALSLVAAAYAAPGSTVAVEDPTFPGIADACRGAGARVLGITAGAAGIDVDALAATVARADVSAVVLVPTFQTPTGTTLPIAARRALGELAERTGVLLVDDAAVAGLPLGAAPPPPLSAFAAPGSVVTIGSLSKLAWAGLRVGWIRAPAPMIDHLAALKGASDLGSSLIGQAVAAEVVAAAPALRSVRVAELAERLATLAAALAARLPEWTWHRPGGGCVLWVRLPRGGATELAHRAEAAGVLVTPGPVTSVSGRYDDHLVLPFDHAPAVLESAVDRLAATANRGWLGSAPPG